MYLTILRLCFKLVLWPASPADNVLLIIRERKMRRIPLTPAFLCHSQILYLSPDRGRNSVSGPVSVFPEFSLARDTTLLYYLMQTGISFSAYRF